MEVPSRRISFEVHAESRYRPVFLLRLSLLLLLLSLLFLTSDAINVNYGSNEAVAVAKDNELSWDSWIDFDMLPEEPITPLQRDVAIERDPFVASSSHSKRDHTKAAISPQQYNELEHIIRSNLTHSPELVSVLLAMLVDYDNHRLDTLTKLLNEKTRYGTIQILKEIAESQTLDEYDCDQPITCSYLWCPSCSYYFFMDNHSGKRCLLEKTPKSINDVYGVARKKVYLSEIVLFKPVLNLGVGATTEEIAEINEYGSHLQTVVINALRSYLNETISKHIDSAFLSCRAKGGPDIYDKVVRMTNGYAGKKADPDYRVGNVLDAMGCRITVPSTSVLWTAFQLVQQVLKVKDHGNILEIENFYAEPKQSSYAYRVIPIISTFELEGDKYSFELQLTTERASIAADLFHNTIYKQYLPLTSQERDSIFNIWEESAAEEQEDARQITC